MVFVRNALLTISTLLNGFEHVLVSTVGPGVRTDNVVGHLIDTRVRTVNSRGKNSNTIAQPGYHEGLVKCNPQFHLLN